MGNPNKSKPKQFRPAAIVMVGCLVARQMPKLNWQNVYRERNAPKISSHRVEPTNCVRVNTNHPYRLQLNNSIKVFVVMCQPHAPHPKVFHWHAPKTAPQACHTRALGMIPLTRSACNLRAIHLTNNYLRSPNTYPSHVLVTSPVTGHS
jgi:hypothetical protein